ncbi:MAG TPA: putative quinol monooxygenase [Sediminibacterium sp.]|nr:putative quinol monooxygenase [Sediminibacterium sp.]
MKKSYLIAAMAFCVAHAFAQQHPEIRIARITIDSMQIDRYKAFLKEQMETAVRVEPGVISYTVYADKSNPAVLTILERYADHAAYLAHRESPHFKKYKAAVAGMVKSLELSELEPILSAAKENIQ